MNNVENYEVNIYILGYFLDGFPIGGVWEINATRVGRGKQSKTSRLPCAVRLLTLAPQSSTRHPRTLACATR